MNCVGFNSQTVIVPYSAVETSYFTHHDQLSLKHLTFTRRATDSHDGLYFPTVSYSLTPLVPTIFLDLLLQWLCKVLQSSTGSCLGSRSS